MFSQLNDNNPPTDGETAPSRSSTNLLANIGRFVPIVILSAFTVLIFIQLQAVSLRVASQQQQIYDLKT